MIGTLLLAAVLAQTPPPHTVSPPPLIAAPQPVGAAPPQRLAAPSAPRPAPTAAGSASERRQAELRATLEKRKARRAQGAATRAGVLAGVQQRATAAVEASQAAQAQTLATQAQLSQSQAMQSIAQAEQLRAMIDRSRYILQTQQAGIPQVYVPGQGMVPYANSVAAPVSPILVPYPLNSFAP